MSLFDKQIREIRRIMKTSDAIRHPVSPEFDWPSGGDRNFVLKQDTAVELGSPRAESISFSIWSEQTELVEDDCVFVLGPSLEECAGRSVPFGQIALLGIERTEGKNDYQLFRELEEVKYRIDLKGYMRRGVSQFLREWSRVGSEALERGFSLQTLGNELVRCYKSLEYVSSVNILLVTAEPPLAAIKPVAVKILRIIEAMNKMLNESIPDCDNCEYQDICREVEELRNLRKLKLKSDANSI